MEEMNLTPEVEEVIEAAPEVQEPEYVEVVDIQFRPGQKVYYFDPDGREIRQFDHLIIDTARGPEYGICSAGNHRVNIKDVVLPLRKVLRFATEADEKQMIEMRNKEKKAYQVCLQKIAEHNLDMQLVSAEYSFDGSKILFFFTADERVDFRELVKNLASIFHTRIELRQIGVRDKAKMVGGLGICGRPIKGKAKIEFEHVLTHEKYEFEVSGEKLQYVTIPVGYQHSINNIGDDEMILILWANELFDPNIPDTFVMEG